MKLTGKNRLYRQLIATSLIMGGALQMVAPVLAAGTTAGIGISNTATGTYEDPNNAGVPINSTSNTVTITVAEVAGITVTASGVSNKTGGSAAITAGSQLYYTYTITNVGNAPTRFRIPNLATVTGPGTVSGAVQTDSATPGTFADISGSELITGSIAVGGTVQVRVPIAVNSTATNGQSISVQLGQTPSGNDQNVARVADGGDVYTVVPASDTAGPPVNGVREASATQAAPVGSSITPQAFATILLTHGAFTTPTTANDIRTGSLPYSLSLRVESTAPAGSTLTPSDLVGTTINVTGTGITATDSFVLISDAIPVGTTLTGTPTAPGTNWKVVYSTDDPTVTNKAPNDPSVPWTTALPSGGASAVKRVGFIYDTTANGAIAKGTTVTGFSFSVSPTANATTNINDIAQVFGQTTAGAGNPLVYDESGDQNPSNYNDNGTPGSNTPTNGVANPSADGTDPNNNNTGTGLGGEDNIFSISGPSPAGTGILNGPNGAPTATGPSGGNNDDYTNKSLVIPPNLGGVDASGNPVALPGTFTPAAVSFTNTAQNTGTATADISLVPATPAAAGDIPNNTTATISQGANSATYTYNGAVWTFTSGQGTANGAAISGTNPLRLAAVPANGTANYGVGIQLPTGIKQLTGYPVTITAFVATTQASGPLTTDAQNKTIDQLYAGFLKLYKESRIIQGNGPALANAADASYSTSNKKPAPGNIIQYRVTYTNISTTGGTGDVLLNATKVVITEDGTLSTTAGDGKNSWALDNDGNGVIDTSNMVGKTTDSNSGTITFYSGSPATTPAVDETGTTQSTDVTKYIDTVPGAVAPGANGTFTFQRLVN